MSIQARSKFFFLKSVIEQEAALLGEDLSCYIAIGQLQEVLGKHLQLLANMDTQISRLFLDRAIIQQRCYDEHTRLLGLFRRIPASHAAYMPAGSLIAPSALASIPLPPLATSPPTIQQLRVELATEHEY